MNDPKWGQWIGSIIDDKGVEVRSMLNIEKRRPGFAQVLTHIPIYREIRTIASFVVPEFENEVTIQSADVRFFDVISGALIPVEAVFR